MGGLGFGSRGFRLWRLKLRVLVCYELKTLELSASPLKPFFHEQYLHLILGFGVWGAKSGQQPQATWCAKVPAS